MSLPSVFGPNDQINAQGHRLIASTLIENFSGRRFTSVQLSSCRIRKPICAPKIPNGC